MPFLFVYLCDLLDELERPHLQICPPLPRILENHRKKTILDWFYLQGRNLNLVSTDDATVMSMLRPEKMTDRIYGLDAGRLELLIARTLSLSKEQYSNLQKWQDGPHEGDLGKCVDKVMEGMKGTAAPVKSNAVTAEEIDQCLLRIASYNKNSSPAVQSLSSKWSRHDPIDLLGSFYCRLKGREAKWLTRFILKDYGHVKIPEDLGMGANYSGLPNCLNVSIQLPTSPPVPSIREGTKIIKGVGTTKAPPPTPPMSSPLAPEPVASKSPAKPVIIDLSGPEPEKRLINTSLAAPSMNKVLPGPSRSTCSSRTLAAKSPTHHLPSSSRSDCSSTTLMATSSTPSPSASRPVLGPISSNSSNRLPTIPRSPPRPRSLSPIIHPGKGHCQLTTSSTSKTCPLTRCIFLLAPCVTKNPYITENLLPWHGCLYLTSINALSSPHLPHRCPKTGKRYRKIALVDVDPNRPSQTLAFLKEIQNLDLKRRCSEKERNMKREKSDEGKKEWVEVYDWRLLECIGKQDQGKELDYNPWKRCWMCAV